MNTVSDAIRISGCQPTSDSFWIDVFKPRAEIAQTRHQRDALETGSFASLGINPKLLMIACPANAIRNSGKIGPSLATGEPGCRPKYHAKTITTGISIATRSSLT